MHNNIIQNRELENCFDKLEQLSSKIADSITIGDFGEVTKLDLARKVILQKISKDAANAAAVFPMPVGAAARWWPLFFKAPIESSSITFCPSLSFLWAKKELISIVLCSAISDCHCRLTKRFLGDICEN